jgi:hypothetical protein
MTAIRICFANFAIWGGLIFWAAPAHADYFTSWVATTCDLQSGRAAVRFGYADADDPPLFIVQEKPSLDDGISTIPVTNASQRDASCKLKNGTEVKIRLGARYYEGDQFSVWVNGIRIAHDIIGDDNLPYEILVYPDGFRFCKFRLPPGDWVYDVTAAAQKPTPIHCETTLTPISGTRDLVEYPADPRSRRPETASIIVAKANAPFCHEMILPAPPNANFKFYIGVPEKLGSSVGADEWSAPVYLFPQDRGGRPSVSTVLFDFWDTGQKVPVYLLNSGGTFTTEFAVVPDQGATKDDVIQVAASAGNFWEASQKAATTKGWSVYTAAGTPYDQEAIGITFARIHNASYLLYGASRGSENDPITVLMKPQRGGKLTTVCTFQEIRAHF